MLPHQCGLDYKVSGAMIAIFGTLGSQPSDNFQGDQCYCSVITILISP